MFDNCIYSLCLSISVLFVTNVFGQRHFSFTPNTGNNMTVLVQSSIKPTINNSPLAMGDEIAVFTPGGLCVGAIVWNGKNITITVWGDNEQTPAIDGAKAGEKLLFKIWASKQATEFDASITYASGGHSYSADGIAVLSTFAALQKDISADNAQHDTLSKSNLSETINPIKRVTSSSATIQVPSRSSSFTPQHRSYPRAGQVVDSKIDSSQVLLIEPKDSIVFSSDSIILKWKSTGFNALRYRVELSKDSTMNNIFIDTALNSNDTTMVLRLLTNGAYWWRVRYNNGNERESFSDKRTFKVNMPAVQPENYQISWQAQNFNDSLCSINYTLPFRSAVKFTIKDQNGKTIRQLTENQTPGSHSIKIEIMTLIKGKYLYALKTGSFTIEGSFFIK